MTAQMNDYYTRKPTGSAQKNAQQPRFKSMLSQLSSIQAMVNDPEIAPADLSVENVDNATTAERSTLSNEGHVTATEKALDDISQTKPDHINAGVKMSAGSDVGGYVYLVLTRISALSLTSSRASRHRSS